MSWKSITPNMASTRSEKLQVISSYFQSLEKRSQILSKKLNYILSKVGDSDWLSKVNYTLDNTNHVMTLTGYTGSSRPEIPTFATVNSTYYDVDKANVKTVTISSNGGSEPTRTTFECITGYTLGSIYSSLGQPTKTNYVFEGWYTAASGGSAVSATTVVSANMTIYAHWKYMPQTFNIGLPRVSFAYTPAGGQTIYGGSEVSRVFVSPPTIDINAPVDINVTMHFRIVTTTGSSNETAVFKCDAGTKTFKQISGFVGGAQMYQTHVTATPRDSVIGVASGYTYSGGTFTRN